MEKKLPKECSRSLLASFLPFDLVCRHGADNNRWNFNGELLKRRHSIIPEDQIFFKALKVLRKSFGEFTDNNVVLVKELFAVRERIYQTLFNLCWVYKIFDCHRLEQNLKYSEAYKQLITELLLAVENDNPHILKEFCISLNLDEDFYYLLKTKHVYALDKEQAEENGKMCFNLLRLKREYYAFGKIALLFNKRNAVVYAIRKLAEMAKKKPKRLPKILSIRENGDLLSDGALKDHSFALSLSVIELAREILDKNLPGGRELCEKLHYDFLEADKHFEAAMIGVLLDNLEYGKFIRSELYLRGDYHKGMALTLALAEKDPEFGWEIAADWAKKNIGSGLPPIAAGNLISVLVRGKYSNLDQVKLVRKTVNALLKAGGYHSLYYACQILLELAKITGQWPVIEEFLDFPCWERNPNPDSETELFYLSVFTSYLKACPDSLERRNLRTVISSFGDEARYGINISNYILRNAPNKLSRLWSEYLPSFSRLKKAFLEAKSLGGGMWDRADFFKIATFSVARMQVLNLEETEKLFKAIAFDRPLKISEFITERCFKVLNDWEIYSALRKWLAYYSSDDDKSEFPSLLNDSYQCLAVGQKKFLLAALNGDSKGDYRFFETLLKAFLLDALAKKIGAKDFGPKLAEKLSVEKTVKLLVHFELLKKEPVYTRKLYRQLMLAVLENRFSDFIGNIGQKNRTGRKISIHNRKVESVFRKAGIDWEQWENFSGTETVQVSQYRQNLREEKWQELEKEFQNLQKEFAGSRIFGSVRKDIIALQKQKRTLTVSEQDLEDKELNGAWLKNFFPTYLGGLDYMKRRGMELEPMKSSTTFFLTFERIRLLLGCWVIKPIDTKKFTVRKWKRDPAHDLFHGYYSDCCLKIGSSEKNYQPHPRVHDLRIPFNNIPAGILEYLIDKGIQVAEVIDEDSGETVAQCWLFVSLGKNGESILVADTFDIKREYQKQSRYNGAVREAMFKFLRRYAKAIGAKQAVLGKKGPGSYSVNKYIETAGFKTVYLPKIKKLGGYWLYRKYFLETIGTRVAYLIE